MEPKKNPAYDIHRKSGLIFMGSLALSLALVILAFEWKQAHFKTKPRAEDHAIADVLLIDLPTRFEELRPTQARQVNPNNIIEVKDDVVTDSDDVITFEDIVPETPFLPVSDIDMLPKEKAPVDSVFRIVEMMPEPAGGYKEFYKTLSNTLRYPLKAKRAHTTGKVFIEFVVNEDDRLSDFKVVKGIGNGCDEEAIRIISGTKWKAGRQRGRPVKVRLVQTINFQLQ